MEEELDKAINYIANDQVFNEENYPGYSKLNEQQQKVFAVKHQLFKLLENLPIFTIGAKAVLLGEDEDPLIEPKLVEACVQTLINILKLCEIVGIEKTIAVHDEVFDANNIDNLHYLFLDYISKIATECAKFDRGEHFEEANVVSAVDDLWSHFVSITLPCTIFDLCKIAPYYSKSK